MSKPTNLEKKSVPSGDVPQWHAISKEEAISACGLSMDLRSKGLTSEEAKQRLERYGPNQMSEKERKTLLQRIWTQLYNMMVGILVVVAVVSLIKGITNTGQSRVTNFIEVGLIVFVVT
jgi:magnesium-transporting ATPase (P-type)